MSVFNQLENIESSFRHIKIFTLTVVTCSALVSMSALYFGYRAASQNANRIYTLVNGKAFEAISTSRDQNIPVEARDHIKVFHQYFFSLDPDEKVIEDHMSKAFYLADSSAKGKYNDLKENNYFGTIISGNISQQVEMDSISISTASYPYLFRYYGKEKIIRPTVTVMRSLVTEGFLRNTARSDNNPHGFLIEHWTILENKDLSKETR